MKAVFLLEGGGDCMRCKTAGFFVLLFTLSAFALAQKNEASLSIGALGTSGQTAFACFVNSTTCNGPFDMHTSTNVALEADYVREVFNFRIASLGAEFPVVGVPRQDVTTTFNGVSRNTTRSTLFFTPSARIKFLPSRPISPFVSLGGGLARHDGTGAATRGALQFGGGVDFRTPVPHVGIRAEVRDFWATGLQENTSLVRITPERQHNVLGGLGVVIKF